MFAMIGRRTAKRKGIPTATPLGAPLDCGVQVSRYAAGADHHHRVFLLKFKSYYR